MSSLWKVGTIDIYVLKHTKKADIKLAKLTTLDSSDSSVIHFFGTGAKEISLKGKVFDETNFAAIEAYYNAGTTIAVTSHRGDEGDFIIKDASFDEYGPFVKLSLPGYATDPEDVSIYEFSLDLIKV